MTSEPSEPLPPGVADVELAAEPGEVDLGEGQVVPADVTVTLALSPTPQLRVHLELPYGTLDLSHFGLAAEGHWLPLTMPARKVEAEVQPYHVTLLGKSEITARPSAQGIRLPAAGHAARLDFRLLNFPEFRVPVQVPVPGSIRVARMEADGWRVQLAHTNDTAGAVKYAKSRLAFALTHIGRIVRLDGSEFPVEAGQRVLSCLHYFLAFARGGWCGPLLPVGTDATEARIWEEWVVPTASRWEPLWTWFDAQRADLLADVFPGFWRLWGAPDDWQISLRKVVHWFVSSCEGDGGVEGSTILAQTALELLAWMYLVVDGELSANRFDRGMNAAERIELLLTRLGIPISVPAELPALSAFAAEPADPWTGPQTLTRLRNSYTHPKPRDHEATASGDAKFEALKLGLWYVDLVLLRLTGHTGYYSNRLRRRRGGGQVERVPWGAIRGSDPAGSGSSDPPSA